MSKDSNKSTLVSVIVAIIIFVAVGVFVLVLFNRTNQENTFVYEDNQLVISGMYSKTYSIDNLDDIELLDSVPSIGQKINGAGLRGVYKGVFMVEGLGKSDVYIHNKNSKCILITTSNKPLLISLYDEEDTIALYNQLEALIIVNE